MAKIVRRNSMVISRLACFLICSALTSSGFGSESGDAVCEAGARAAEEKNYDRAMNIWAENSVDASTKMKLRAILDCLEWTRIASDYESAAAWIFAKADEDNVQAALYTGLLYGSGVGVEPDLDAAIDWLDRAAEKGSEAAKFIGDGLKEHIEKTKEK